MEEVVETAVCGVIALVLFIDETVDWIASIHPYADIVCAVFLVSLVLICAFAELSSRCREGRYG